MLFQAALLIVIVIDALLCWVSYLKKKITLRIITKPLFCLLLIVLVTSTIELNKHVTLFCVGLFFSFLGDLLLLKEGLQWFACGLVSFLVGHFCYIYGYFLTLYPGVTLPALLVLLAGSSVCVALMQGAKSKTQKIFTLPVHIYTCGLVGGCFCAYCTLGSETGRDWNFLSSLMTAVGYTFFVVSDAVLAYHTFVHKTMLSSMTIITTYHIAQLLLMGGLIYKELESSLLPSLI